MMDNSRSCTPDSVCSASTGGMAPAELYDSDNESLDESIEQTIAVSITLARAHNYNDTYILSSYLCIIHGCIHTHQ